MKSKKENALNPGRRERRVALEKRRRVAEMSVEEMRRELLTSEVTGLGNRRAFDEAGPAPAIAMCDMDGLKALNNYGYYVGNTVLVAMAHSLRRVGLDAYHDKGDEFLCRGSHLDELRTRLEQARSILRDHAAIVEPPGGGWLTVTGADFSYGVGNNLRQAESDLRRHKAERERAGRIGRGELRAIRVSLQGTKDRSSPREASDKGIRGYRSADGGGNSSARVTSVIVSGAQRHLGEPCAVHSLLEGSLSGDENDGSLAPRHRDHSARSGF